jgi:hypothetical protein
MTIAMCVGLEKAAEQLLFSRPFWYFLWQCQKVDKKESLTISKKPIPPFVLKQKVEPKIQGRFNADHS